MFPELVWTVPPPVARLRGAPQAVSATVPAHGAIYLNVVVFGDNAAFGSKHVNLELR